jgi:geranylgeranyl diphosphate synthase type II
MRSDSHIMSRGVCESEIGHLRTVVNDYISGVIPESSQIPVTLREAIRYSLTAGGKRLRPILALLAYKSLGKDPRNIIAPACALELIHTYSLIHDDLPCMDDDDFRRGKPTLHRKFGDAIAVLAGDALHALAFELLASAGNTEIVRDVSRAIGITGMLAGQVADVEAEGKTVSLKDIEYIHANKTGALITVSVRVGAVLGEAGPDQLSRFSSYGSKIGLAFQIIDDLLDITGSQENLGKDVGSDSRNRKATYPGAVGIDESRRAAASLVEAAKSDIVEACDSYELFHYVADFVLDRVK